MVLSIKSGHDVGYLTGPVAGGRESYYSGAVAAGEPTGRWYGSGATVLGLDGEVDNDVLEAVYSHLIDPRDPAAESRSTWGEAETLGAAHRQYRSADDLYAAMLEKNPTASPEDRSVMRLTADRSARQAIAFEDATFSPSKSVSVLGCALERAANDARSAGDETAADEWATRHRAVENAVMAGARASIDYLEREASTARAGRHGGGEGRWVDTAGFTVAQFLQHDSRDHDPQLHVHQAILNRQLCDDGAWRGLDGVALGLHKGAAGAIGERVMEGHLAQALGVRFVDRVDGHGREVEGVSQDVLDLFSSRRREVTGKTAELTEAFRERFNREPSLIEQRRLSQQATLATRSAKEHGGESLEQRLDRWEALTRAEVGIGLAGVAQGVMERQTEVGAAQRFSAEDVVQRALGALAEERQSWTRSDILRAVSDALPANLGVAPERLGELLDGLTDVAVGRAVNLSPERAEVDLTPDHFRRRDGESQFTRPGATRYTADETRAAEQYLRAAAVTRGAPAITVDEANAVIARYAESGRELGADQAAALRGVLTAGAQVSVLTAPAGSGKTFLMGVLAESWSHGRVIGLAPSQVAANQLAEEGLTAWNTTAWLRSGDAAAKPAGGDVVVIDEASMATTGQLREIEQRCGQVGAQLLVVGDPRQLAQVGPGGALADLGERAAHYELTEVRRQEEAWEREASLRLRNGDSSALAEYDKHGRLVAGGTAEQAERAAGRAWLADTLAGKDSLLLVGSNEQAARVSAALRSELVSLGRVEERGVELGLQGVVAGVGDIVQGRHNGWDHIGRDGNTQAPLNRDTYRVVAVRENGGLTVQRTGGESSDLNLSPEYVTEHLALGYASTTHAAQGRTVDRCHDLVGSYVGMTRGRESNTAWMTTRPTASDASPGEAQTVHERSARAVMADRLEAHQEQRSSLAEQEQLVEDARSTATHLGQLIAGTQQECAGRTGRILDGLVAAGLLDDRHRADLAADDGMRALDRLVRTAELAGHNPTELLRQAVEGRSLDDARSPAQVLHHRITSGHQGDLTPSVSSARDLVPTGVLNEQDQAWFEQRASAIDTRRAELGQRLAEKPEPWASDALGQVPVDVVDRLEWEQKAGWAAAYRELAEHADATDPLGPAPPAGLPEFSALFHAAHKALDLPEAGAEEAGLSDGRLRNRVAAYERDEAWAPRFVADDLAETHRAHAAAGTNAELWEARAALAASRTESEQLRAAAAVERSKADAAARHATDLRRVDDARAHWYAHTAVERDLAERARCELGNRGIDLAAEPQVTAEEWLAEHERDQVVQDERQELEEREVVDVDAATVAVPETSTEDILDWNSTGAQQEPVEGKELYEEHLAAEVDKPAAVPLVFEVPDTGTEDIVDWNTTDVDTDEVETGDVYEEHLIDEVDAVDEEPAVDVPDTGTEDILGWNTAEQAGEDTAEEVYEEHLAEDVASVVEEPPVEVPDTATDDIADWNGPTAPIEEVTPEEIYEEHLLKELPDEDEHVEYEEVLNDMSADPLAQPPETDMSDIRETSLPEPSEHSDENARLSADHVAAAVQRAEAADAELRNREASEAARWHEEADVEEADGEEDHEHNARVAVDA